MSMVQDQEQESKDWIVDVNASVTHGPMTYGEALRLREALLDVDGVTDIEVLKQ